MNVEKSWVLVVFSLVLIILFFLGGSSMLFAETPVKNSENPGSVDLQNTDWDAEEPEKTKEADAPIDLQNTDWDAEEPEKPKEELSPIDLQNTDWDAEEPKKTGEEAAPVNLQNTDWDEDSPKDAPGQQMKPPARAGVVELNDGEISLIHWSGGFLFVIYLFGGFLTAYFLRNAGISKRCPPDVLILLHIFWPLEWILSPFFRNPVTLVNQGG
ncbi:MAG: hypothetical protein HQM13_23265 [SAR324 cluster bacterium]|nr:hypothetical protein [SAR324 cluster bacterium]